MEVDARCEELESCLLRLFDNTDEKMVVKYACEVIFAMADMIKRKEKTSSMDWKRVFSTLTGSLSVNFAARVVRYVRLFQVVIPQPDFHHLYHILIQVLIRIVERDNATFDLQLCRYMNDFCMRYIIWRKDSLVYKYKPQSILPVNELIRLADAFPICLPPGLVFKYLEVLGELMHDRANRNYFRELVDLIERFCLLGTSIKPVCCVEWIHVGVGFSWHESLKKLISCDASGTLARCYITTCVAEKEIKRAYSCMCDWSLQKEFPWLIWRYRQLMLEKTIERKAYSEALFRLGKYKEARLTYLFLEKMVAENLVFLGYTLAVRSGMPKGDEYLNKIVNREVLVVQEIEYSDSVLQLELNLDSEVLFVDCDSKAHEAISVFQSFSGNSVVGLDSEWKPCFGPSKNLPSILQLSSRDRAVVLDLLWLFCENNRPASFDQLMDALACLFSRRDIYKIGFGFLGDLTNLRKAYPHNAWDSLDSLVELSKLRVTKDGQGNFTFSVSRKNRGGLKDLVSIVTNGKKTLCKLEQMSDWERRPLTREQLTYACLDAHCLTKIFDVLFEDVSSLPAGLVLSNQCTLKGQTNGAPSDMSQKSVEKLEKAAVERMSALTASACVVPLKKRVVSVKDIARLFSVESRVVLKTMAYMYSFVDGCGDTPILVLIRGDSYVNEELLKETLSSTAKVTARKATVNECARIFELPVGGVGPFPNDEGIVVYVDQAILELSPEEHVYTGFGSRHHVLKVKNVEALLKLLPKSHKISTLSKLSVHKRLGSATSQGTCKSFVVDDMLGRLGKVLRIIGQDCLLFHEVPGLVDLSRKYTQGGEKNDEHAKQRRTEARKKQIEILLCIAKQQNRTILTTDRRSLGQNPQACIVENNGDRIEQLKEVCTRFDLELKRESFLSRCVKCNGVGFTLLSAEQVQNIRDQKVPKAVLEKMDVFYSCKQRDCDAIFWEGSKFDKCCENYEWIYGEDDGLFSAMMHDR